MEGVLSGDRRQLSRALTAVDNQSRQGAELLRLLHPHTGKSQVIGITGPAGSGKSTLTCEVAKEFRRRNKTVAIIAVDPSSPFAGGAILGDRIRMQDLSGDPGVWMRSLATRGAMGGLSDSTVDMVQVYDAFGFDVIIIETVGAGQDEVDIIRTAHTIVVVAIPGGGDDIQAMKAGILEIADIFVVNKADRDGADTVAAQLREMMALSPSRKSSRRTPIIKTIALRGTGVDELATAMETHLAEIKESGLLTRKESERARHQILALARRALFQRVMQAQSPTRALEKGVAAVMRRELDPRSVAEALVELVVPSGEPAAAKA
ncbi:MAG: methylmalonyl Co-A mutase-associated GTPase MeaB [Chloroflexi bacterium]|nr:methylmalonyl Co-A mutase-associated GTPase MeaB [Chloroflexota bacterium]